jgi:hypothetical protein
MIEAPKMKTTEHVTTSARKDCAIAMKKHSEQGYHCAKFTLAFPFLATFDAAVVPQVQLLRCGGKYGSHE